MTWLQYSMHSPIDRPIEYPKYDNSEIAEQRYECWDVVKMIDAHLIHQLKHMKRVYTVLEVTYGTRIKFLDDKWDCSRITRPRRESHEYTN